MYTEERIIYEILNTVRSGEFNLDEPLTERLLRSYLQTYRINHIVQTYNKGKSINDVCFQEIDNITFTPENNVFTCDILPSIAPLSENYGVYFYKNDYPIIVLNSRKWKNHQKDRMNKNQPAIKLINNKAYLYLGIANQATQFDDDYSNSELNLTIAELAKESALESITLQGRFLLVDPDDQPGYDFTKSVYPFPNESIAKLITSVTARELNIFLRTASDQVGNKFSNETDNPQTEEF